MANTFETGDVLDGGEGRDVLNADLTASLSGSVPIAPTISAETDSIEVVNLRAQFPNLADTTIDAEKMSGVEEWWSDNSRSGILVEDIRSNPADTAFGMRDTDPGVSFASYINANHLEGGTEVGESAFNFTIREQGALGNELNDITVNGIRFELNGERYQLDGADVEAANTWAELQTALQADIDATEGLEGLTVAHRGNGQFVVTDPAAGDFVIDPAGTVISSSTTNEVKDASLGVPQVTDLPTETDVFLDGAGNGSQGGVMDVGVMSGSRGVEVFNVNVLHDSHLATQGTVAPAALMSSNLRTGEQYLEEVYVEGEGSLLLGTSSVVAGVSTTTDDRLQNDGLVDVRVFDASGFEQELKLGASLTNNSISRYLDDAEEPVQFTYNLGDGGSNFSLNLANTLSTDNDFMLDINGGVQDDRINLSGNYSLANVSIDGGEGRNTLETSSSIGVNPSSTPAAFENIQKLVLAGNTIINADMTPLAGVEELVVATTGGANSQINDLEADTTVSLSGKNQTLGNNSNANQAIGNINLQDAKSTTQRVDLDNTARNSGTLTVNQVLVTESATGTSNVDELLLSSNGQRNTTNVVRDIQAADASEVTLEGTQMLSAHVSSLATNPNQALTIDGSGLESGLTLAVNGALLVEGSNDVITGPATEDDKLALYGAINTDATISGFETLQFGWLGGSNNFSALTGAAAVSGVFDAANTSDVDTYVVGNLQGGNDLTIDNLSNGDTVIFGDADSTNGNQILGTGGNDITLSGSGSGTLNIATVDALNGVNLNFFGDLFIDGFNTINADVASPDFGPTALTPNLVLDNATGIDLDAATITAGDSASSFVTDSGAGLDALEVDNIVKNLVITGGDEQTTDSLTLTSDLPASMSVIDVSGYHGAFTASLGNAVIEDPNNAGQHISANTDTRFVLDGDDATITLTDLATDSDPTTAGAGLPAGDAASIDFNTIFEFTEAPAAQVGGNPAVTWTIDNFVSADAQNAGNSNYSILDLSDLGIGSFAELDFADDTTAGGGVTITEEGGNSTWEIVLTGVLEADLAPSENFIFAS